MGAGGAGGTNDGAGVIGSNSVFQGIVSLGGGRSGAFGRDGGSGGGASAVGVSPSSGSGAGLTAGAGAMGSAANVAAYLAWDAEL